MNTETLLRKLLLDNASNDLVRRCMIAFDNRASNSYKSTPPCPIKEIRDIYTRRATIDKDKRGVVEGFDQLIPALNVETDAELIVHGYDTGKESFTIFTNTSTTRLIGVLIS